MLRMPVNEVIRRIREETGLSEEEIKNQIQAKLKSLDGLISEEGAAYIVASELGVKLFKDVGSGRLKIKNIISGMNNVEIVGKVLQVKQPITFKKEDKSGEVGSILVGDESGKIRVVIWDKRVDWLKEGRIKEGATVKIKNAYAKENMYGVPELHLRNRSRLILEPEGIDIVLPPIQKKAISELEIGKQAVILGTIVKIFPVRFFTACGECGKKIEDVCNKHPKADVKLLPVLNFILDDGTAAVRLVAFGERVEGLLRTPSKEIQDILENDGEFALAEFINSKLLGEVIMCEGRLIENKAFEREEFVISDISWPNPIDLAKALLGEEHA